MRSGPGAGLMTCLALLSLPGAAGASDASGFAIAAARPGWHPSTQAVYGRVVVADGRIWVVRTQGRRSTVATNGGVIEVESRPLSGGPSRRWRQALPASADPRRFTDARVAVVAESAGRVYVQVRRCEQPVGSSASGVGAECEDDRVVGYDAESGQFVETTPADDRTGLAPVVGGGALLLHYGAQYVATLSDPVTGTVYPGPADTQLRTPTLGVTGAFAGPYFLSFRGGARTSLSQVDYRTGATVRVLAVRDMYRASGLASTDDVQLERLPQPDGSMGIEASSAAPGDSPVRGLTPAYIDAAGRTHRVGDKLRSAYATSATPAIGRVVVSAEGGTRRKDGRRVARCSGVWLTDASGKRGAEISGRGALAVAGTPISWDGRYAVWQRSAGGVLRFIVRDLRGIRLRRAERPACRPRPLGS